MSEFESPPEAAEAAPSAEATPVPRKRPKPGERRAQILQTLAAMLEQPGAERITTAALAARLSVSEAALYRHFASKAQMYEALIDFIEQSVLTLVQQVVGRELPTPEQGADVGTRQAARVVALVLQFGERNPGLARLMAGDALVLEHERLGQRMNHFFDKIELHLKDILYPHASANAHPTPTVQAQVQAGALTALAIGQIHRFVRSNFKRKPTERLAETLGQVLH